MKWHTYYLITLLFLFYSLISLADRAFLLSCTKSEDSKFLSLSFKFDKAFKYHCLLLPDPNRFVIDFENATLQTTLPKEADTYIKKVRNGDHGDKYVRVVFDLKQKIHYSTMLSEQDHELTIKLRKDEEQDAKITSPIPISKKRIRSVKKEESSFAAISQAIEKEKKEHADIKVTDMSSSPESLLQMSDAPQSKNIVIVIDPGHGGKDPGAAGPHGAVEKDVVLKISKQLQAMLNEEPGFCAVLTRSTDYYIPLRKRLSIARKNHADMFIAIHADAYQHSQATGASVYALSQRGATSEAARWLAEKENESELDGLGNELADKDAILRSVLIDLSQTHTIESSLHIGHTVLDHLGKIGRLHHPRVEQAAFVVLKSPDIPSILVETGFLSNSCEEEKLITSQYQHQTAYAIKEGIKQYFTYNSAGAGWFQHGDKKEAATPLEKKTSQGKTS